MKNSKDKYKYYVYSSKYVYVYASIAIYFMHEHVCWWAKATSVCQVFEFGPEHIHVHVYIHWACEYI